MSSARIAVVGGGAWGTALAVHLARCGHSVALWIRESELVLRMRERRDNPVHLPGVSVPAAVEPHGELGPVLERAEAVLFAVPTPFARQVLEEVEPRLAPGVPVIVAGKGIEEQTLAFPLDVAREACGGARPLAVLSGPSFAPEVAAGRPTAVVIAAEDVALAKTVQRMISSQVLRLYTNRDPLGVQICGALKNVMAIAAGVEDSLGMGTNARAALITRGLAEMARLGQALGARPDTFRGLAGLGDLVLTCTGELSRNRRVGQRLGRGERLQDILSASRFVAEGVRTTSSARALALRECVDMPIVEQVYGLLYEDRAPHEALQNLLSRRLTAEDEEVQSTGPEDG